MLQWYRKDKSLILQHNIAATANCTTSYRSRDEMKKRESAQCHKPKKQPITQDEQAQYGPPDKDFYLNEGPTGNSVTFTSERK